MVKTIHLVELNICGVIPKIIYEFMNIIKKNKVLMVKGKR